MGLLALFNDFSFFTRDGTKIIQRADVKGRCWGMLAHHSTQRRLISILGRGMLSLKERLRIMTFTPIDLQTWPRGQMFCYFSKMAPTGYSLTVNLDVTALRKTLKAAGLKFFPAYLWLVTKNLNRQTAFKIAEKDGVLGFYDTLTPLYASFHEDDHTFSLMWTDYTDSFSLFYQAYIEHQANFGHVHGVLSQPQTPPPANAYTISCIPWIPFTHFAVHSDENKPYYFPTIEAGKFFEQDGQVYMPLSITCHHAATDGYHVKCFLDALQEDMRDFQQYL